MRHIVISCICTAAVAGVLRLQDAKEPAPSAGTPITLKDLELELLDYSKTHKHFFEKLEATDPKTRAAFFNDHLERFSLRPAEAPDSPGFWTSASSLAPLTKSYGTRITKLERRLSRMDAANKERVKLVDAILREMAPRLAPPLTGADK